MNENDDPQYVGPPDLHDGQILEVSAELGELDEVRVLAQGAEGNRYTLTFRGVVSLTAIRPIGMLLYGLAKWERLEGPASYKFVNWEDEDDAALSLISEGFDVAESS
jgi:hypothetical protein